ncbi:MAG: methyltransferase domain-containing protein [Acidobacteriaceae bacterium]|jgi:2-polyprenyl-3-methyl-5-hydroxy-6-metoxy-1,4-benzoquinol methylase
MPSDASVDLSRRAAPSELPEWMDEPCTYEDFRKCLNDLGQVNRLTWSYRPTLAFLDAVADAKPGQALRIVDVGSGGGDMLRRVERWAERRGVHVQLTGIDLNPYAARVARELTPASSAIQWLTGDAFTYTEPVDVVLSSLFTHHLEEPEIVRFLAWSEAVAQRGWFVNDLCREAPPYKLFGLLAKAMRWHRFVQHDGPVSFRRSFREDDWERMLGEAGIVVADVRLARWTPGRLCVERLK